MYLGDGVDRSFAVSASAAFAQGEAAPGASAVVSATRWLDVQAGVVRLPDDRFTSLFASASVWLSPSGPTRASVSGAVQTLPQRDGEYLLSVTGGAGFPRPISSGVSFVPQAAMTLSTPTKGGLAPEATFSGAAGLTLETAGGHIVLEPSVAYAVVSESLAGAVSLGLVVPFE